MVKEMNKTVLIPMSFKIQNERENINKCNLRKTGIIASIMAIYITN